jgi:hypothetical protein
MSLTIPQIAERWAERAEEVRTLPYDQALHRPSEWAVCVAASFRKAGGNPTREALDVVLADLAGAQDAIRAFLARQPEPDPVIKGQPFQRVR